MKIILPLLASFLLWACGEKASSDGLEPLNKRVIELEKQLEINQAKVDELGTKVSDVSMSEMFRKWEKIAFLKIGSSEFLPLVTDVGTLTVNLANVEAYANGSKVSLTFGNPLSATITNLKFMIDYGSLDKEGFVIDAKEKTKEVNLVEPLNPASWTEVEIILDSFPVNELGYVRLHDVNISQISLFRKKSK